MQQLSTVVVLVLVPVYVMGAFVASVLAPGSSTVLQDDIEKTIALRFVGDMMFDRYIREKAEINGYDVIFENAFTKKRKDSILVGNLEGPITTFTSVSDYRDPGPNHYRFTFATSVAESLAHAGFDAVFLANNHITNFGDAGYLQTKDWLERSAVNFFGSPDEAYVPWRYATSGISFAFYAFDTWYARDVEKLTENIANESDEVFVVVYAHWGDEYEKIPNIGQKNYAKRFIDAGADFVVGSHPHVVQTKEQYKDKWIYYSLGNFVFDQYFNLEVSCGAVLTLSVEQNNTYTVEEEFVELARDGTTKVSTCREFVAFENK